MSFSLKLWAFRPVHCVGAGLVAVSRVSVTRFATLFPSQLFGENTLEGGQSGQSVINWLMHKTVVTRVVDSQNGVKTSRKSSIFVIVEFVFVGNTHFSVPEWSRFQQEIDCFLQN